MEYCFLVLEYTYLDIRFVLLFQTFLYYIAFYTIFL